MASKADVMKAAAERARAAGFNGRGFALVQYMTAEEREVYYAAENEAHAAHRASLPPAPVRRTVLGAVYCRGGA